MSGSRVPLALVLSEWGRGEGGVGGREKGRISFPMCTSHFCILSFFLSGFVPFGTITVSASEAAIGRPVPRLPHIITMLASDFQCYTQRNIFLHITLKN